VEEVHDLVAVEVVVLRAAEGGSCEAATDGRRAGSGAGAGALELVVVGAERECRQRQLQHHSPAGCGSAGGGWWGGPRRRDVLRRRHPRQVDGGGEAVHDGLRKPAAV
jgi:hypothetical protein